MKIKAIFASCLFVFCSSVAFSNPQTTDVDNFLRTVDLKKIIHTDKAINLMAQMSDPRASTTQIDDMTDFLAITGKSKGIINTWIAEFNDQSEVLDQKAFKASWLGVGEFTQNEIPQTKLQDGLQLVESCIATKTGSPAPDKVARVVLYQSLETHQIIYDYVFKTRGLPPGVCQEILYIPDTSDCEMGMKTYCHETIEDIGAKS